MKHTVCQVATFEHAKCKYELYDYHILMHSGKYIYNETCAICCTSLYNFNSRRSVDIVTFVLECENPIVHTVQIDISALIALMKRNLRQVGTC